MEKLMNILEPITIAHSFRSYYNIKYVLQSMHMRTAIPLMKMKIIVPSGMKMIFRFLPDQILSSL